MIDVMRVAHFHAVPSPFLPPDAAGVGAPPPKVSLSDGSVCIIRCGTNGVLQKEMQWVAHGLEAWIVAYDCHAPTTLFSGADDGKLKGWDVRAPPSAPTFTNSRAHEAGVCALQSHPTIEHCLASGSYDEKLRIWDTRNMRRPTCTADAGGGIWRIKWSPDPMTPEQIVLACMHAGVMNE